MKTKILLMLATGILLLGGCLEQEAKSPGGEVFQRVYPEVIKGNWEPSTPAMKKLMEAEVDNLKNIGVNTVSITVGYDFRQDGSYFVQGEKAIINNLRLAKKNGFAVLLAPNFVGPAGHNFEEEGIQITKEDYLEISEGVALRWASIAEEYKVEFFAPQNEFNFMIKNFAESSSEVARITSDWHKQMLPKIKEVFTGKVMAKLAMIEEEIDTTGYDYVGITVFHGLLELARFRTLVRERYSMLAIMAQKSNSGWLISEAWFPYGGQFFPYTTNNEGRSLDEIQDDYFRISIEEYLRFTENKPAGYIFIAWIMPGMDVKGRPAEQVLKEFYSQM